MNLDGILRYVARLKGISVISALPTFRIAEFSVIEISAENETLFGPLLLSITRLFVHKNDRNSLHRGTVFSCFS